MIAEISAPAASDLRPALVDLAAIGRTAQRKKIALSAAGAIRQGENLRF
jgi:hypothetical protein